MPGHSGRVAARKPAYGCWALRPRLAKDFWEKMSQGPDRIERRSREEERT